MLEGIVSPSYRGQVGDKQDLLEKFRADLIKIPERALISRELRIVVNGDEAQVTQAQLMVFKMEGKERESRDKQQLALRKEGGRWRFVGGLG